MPRPTSPIFKLTPLLHLAAPFPAGLDSDGVGELPGEELPVDEVKVPLVVVETVTPPVAVGVGLPVADVKLLIAEQVVAPLSRPRQSATPSANAKS